MLVELPAQGLLMKVVPLSTREEKRTAILSMMEDMNVRGITSLTEPALGPGGISHHGGFLGSECISVYNDLHNDDLMSVRVNILYLFGTYGAISLQDFESSVPAVGFHSGFGDDWLRLGGVKVFADGIPQTKTAWLHQDYPGGGNGGLVLPGASEEERCEELSRIVAFAHRNGFQVGIHAVGDRAIGACVDALQAAQAEDGKQIRHYLIHADFIGPADIRRVAMNSIGIAAQPVLKWVFGELVESIVGVERSNYQWPLRSLLDAGVHVSFSSDAPVTAPDWLQGIEAAVLRKSKTSGRVCGAEQCITREEAIRAFTMGGAWQDRMDERKGSLEPGRLADFCVLDEDILSVPPDDIHAITNVGTVVGGKVVYDAGLRR